MLLATCKFLFSQIRQFCELIWCCLATSTHLLLLFSNMQANKKKVSVLFVCCVVCVYICDVLCNNHTQYHAPTCTNTHKLRQTDTLHVHAHNHNGFVVYVAVWVLHMGLHVCCVAVCFTRTYIIYCNGHVYLPFFLKPTFINTAYMVEYVVRVYVFMYIYFNVIA